ncbi:hypothetical protein RJT34_11762 [Clitoria ternatea]|uniref:Uncharacterized protein n=1 Tax=Clitoria ternatea TaxID=43366 RepID=A0AAN9JMF5_CLITE
MDFPSTFNFITQASELSCGFLLLGYFSRFFNLLGLFLIFFIYLKIFNFFGGHTPKLRSRAVLLKLDAFEPPPSKPPIPKAPAPRTRRTIISMLKMRCSM